MNKIFNLVGHLMAGSNFHSSLQHYFHTKEIPPEDSSLAKIWSSVTGVLNRIEIDPDLIEAPIVHPVLQYKGVVDCVSQVR